MVARYLKYLGCGAILLALLASFACGQEEPTTPAQSAPAAVQPSPDALEATAALTAGEATAMENQGVSRLQIVRDRGTLVCASINTVAGFGFLDSGGNTVGFDIDLCRAVAAAVLGNPDAVEFRTTTAAERGPAIQSGEIDIMSRNTTWTSTRDAAWGNFAQTMFYDGQGFMVPRSLGITGMLELRDASICVQQGTTTELNIQDFDNQNSMNFDILTFPDGVSSNDAYLSGQCDSLTTDRSGLVSTRSGFDSPDDHIILPGTISEEPLGPLVPHGDDQWFDVVKTVMAILIYAEAYGVTSDNVPSIATGDTKVDRLFGLEGSFGQEALGFPDTVARDVIRGVGNYGEIYERHLTPLGLQRDGSRNALWSNAPCRDCPRGGQIYAAPLR
ncbi:MAG: amino acid ABC transporter substrate-binding protein [Chloroflexi bacterium]|nr:amino acid ABC transporter substrate-binding protein [Chloroflexota bacterium]MYD47756.1 amino acid ABC transporter substrate-binding protein [Chloroflexota bacterium]